MAWLQAELGYLERKGRGKQMAIFGQYTGARVSSLPSGFLGAAMQSAANTQRGLERAGQTIGDALATYGKRKEESEMLDGMIQGQAQRALEINQFLGGGKDGEVSGNIGPDGQAVTGNPDKQTMTGALPGAANVTEQNIPQPVMAEFGIESASPLSQKTNLLYEIAGDQKLVDKFLSGDATLAQKKGLLANLQMYNTKLDDFTKRAAIDEYKFKKSQRDAYNRSFGAGAGDVVVAPEKVETQSFETSATKDELNRILSIDQTGIDPETGKQGSLTPQELDTLESYMKAGGEFRPSVPAPDMAGFNPEAAEGALKITDKEFAGQPGYDVVRGDIQSRLDYYNQTVKPVHEKRLAAYQAKQDENADVLTKLLNYRAIEEDKEMKFSSQPDVARRQDQLVNINNYLSDPDVPQSTKDKLFFLKGEYEKELTNKRKAAGLREDGASRVPGMDNQIDELQSMMDVPPPSYQGSAVLARPDRGLPPKQGFVDDGFSSSIDVTERTPAVTRPASNAENKAARIKSFMDAGGTMTPEVMAQFDKEYPESEIVSRPVPGVAGATALFDSKGRFLQVVTPPTLSASERAAVNAVTFTPNTGFTGVAPSKEEAVKFRQQIADAKKAKSRAEFLMEAAKKGKIDRSWWGKNKGEVQVAAGFLRASLRMEIAGPGAVSEYEQKLLQEVAADPSKLTSLSSLDLGRLGRIITEIDTSLSGQAEVLGLQPVGQSPAGSSAPQMRSFDATGNEVK